MQPKRAFTLIELLVVIVIIGLLATVGLIALSQARTKARNAKCLTDIVQYAKALELYYSDHNAYPNVGYTCLGNYNDKTLLNESQVCGYQTLLFNESENFLNSIKPYIPELPAGAKITCGPYPVFGYFYAIVQTDPFSNHCAKDGGEIQYWLEGINQDCGPGIIYTGNFGGKCTRCIYCGKYK